MAGYKGGRGTHKTGIKKILIPEPQALVYAEQCIQLFIIPVSEFENKFYRWFFVPPASAWRVILELVGFKAGMVGLVGPSQSCGLSVHPPLTTIICL